MTVTLCLPSALFSNYYLYDRLCIVPDALNYKSCRKCPNWVTVDVYNLPNAFKSYAGYTVTDVGGDCHVLAVHNRREALDRAFGPLGSPPSPCA